MRTIYIMACEYYGPVLTDTLLSEAVRIALTVPEAKRFSPRSLL